MQHLFQQSPVLKNLLGAALATGLLCGSAHASVESKTWPASDNAKQFVKDTIVIDMFASPHGTGWTEDKHFHDYLNLARAAGITDDLWKRGYTDEDLRKIYGGNKMRVFDQVWEGEGEKPKSK